MAVRLRLGELAFSWDPAKARANVEKHGVTFEEAAFTWLDVHAIETLDRRRSGDEERWLRIGATLRGAVLVVWSTERSEAGEEVVRIIGARRASNAERRIYEEAEG